MKKENIFQQRLVKAMEERGLRQIDLVNMTGIGKSALNHYIKGIMIPKQNRIYILAKALQVDPIWLSGLPDTPERMLIKKIENVMGEEIPGIKKMKAGKDKPIEYYSDRQTTLERVKNHFLALGTDIETLSDKEIKRVINQVTTLDFLSKTGTNELSLLLSVKIQLENLIMSVNGNYLNNGVLNSDIDKKILFSVLENLNNNFIWLDELSNEIGVSLDLDSEKLIKRILSKKK